MMYMKHGTQQLSVALATLSASVVVAAAASFSENFNSGTLDTNLTVTGTPGYSFALAGGGGRVTEQAGAGVGELYVTTSFAALGNFTVTVQAGRTALGTTTPAALGLMVQSLQGYSAGYADIFFNGSGQIYANLWIPPVVDQASVNQAAPAATFRIRRVSNTLYLEYDAGSGFQTLRSGTHANLAVPLKVSLFLVDQYGATTERSGWFDDLAITADQFFTPTPGFAFTNEPAALRVSWPSAVNNNYAVEYRSEITTTTWTPVGSLLTGTGSTLAVTNWVIGERQRYYRVGRLFDPLPSFSATIEPAAFLVSWPSVAANRYQVEYRSELTGNQWTPQGSPMPGTGSTMSITNWLIGQPHREYRVLEVP